METAIKVDETFSAYSGRDNNPEFSKSRQSNPQMPPNHPEARSYSLALINGLNLASFMETSLFLFLKNKCRRRQLQSKLLVKHILWYRVLVPSVKRHSTDSSDPYLQDKCLLNFAFHDAKRSMKSYDTDEKKKKKKSTYSQRELTSLKEMVRT